MRFIWQHITPLQQSALKIEYFLGLKITDKFSPVILDVGQNCSNFRVTMNIHALTILWSSMQEFDNFPCQRYRLIPNKAWWRLLLARNSYTSRRSSPLRQQPRSLTRLRCWTPVMSITSFKNSSCPCLELIDNCFTATSVPSGNTPCNVHTTENATAQLTILQNI